MEQAWPAEPTFFNPDVTDAALRATRTYTIKQGFFLFANMLPVELWRMFYLKITWPDGRLLEKAIAAVVAMPETR